ncbi:hypothetical protein IIB79_03560 [candidate division KSB1 bacterium]|nr:hypothetical protein [candidate division KSB1 bacterium]
MLTLRYCVCVIASMVLFLNCSEEVTYTIEEVDGVLFVHNLKPKWDEEDRISLEFVRQIGEFDAADENLQFFKPYDIAIDKSGNIYILDSGNYRVQKFNSDGEFMLTFLRQGEGPGELLSSSQIQIDGEGNNHVSDSRNRIVQTFSPEGNPVTSYRPGTILNIFEILENGGILVDGTYANREDVQGGIKPLLQINDQNGEIITKIGSARNYEDMMMKQMGNFTKVDVDDNGFIYLALRYQNLIEKYSPQGKKIFSADRTLSFTESEKMDFVQIDVQGETVNKSTINSFSHELQIDHKSRIWILSHKRQLTTEELGLPESPKDLLNFELYDTNGILLNRIPWENSTTLISYQIFGDRIFFLDAKKEMAVFEYKIVD